MSELIAEEVIAFVTRFKKKLKIDEHGLQKECIEQPQLCEEVGEMASLARAAAKRARLVFEKTVAELYKDIRAHPDKYEISKITESVVEKTAILADVYQKTKNAQIEAEYISDSLSVLQNAIEQRKSMLRDLTTLFVFSYYSGQELHGEENISRDVVKDKIAGLRSDRRKND